MEKKISDIEEGFTKIDGISKEEMEKKISDIEERFTKIDGISKEEICDKLRENNVEEVEEAPIISSSTTHDFRIVAHCFRYLVSISGLKSSEISDLRKKIGMSYTRTKQTETYITDTYEARRKINSMESLKSLSGLLYIIDGEVLEETKVMYWL